MENCLSVLIAGLPDSDKEKIHHELKQKGFQPMLEYADTEEGFLAALDKERWNLLLVDHSLADLNNGELIYRSRQGRPDIPVFILTDTTKENLSRFMSAVSHLSMGTSKNFSHREAEVQFEKKEARYRQLLNSGVSIIYATGADERHQCNFVSDNLYDKMGYSPEQMTDDHKFWTKHVHPKDIARICNEFTRDVGTGSGSLEYRFLHADGQYHWVYDSYKVIKDENGKPLEIFGSWTDVSQTHELNEELSYKASHDELTGALNRQEFERQITRLLNNQTLESKEHALCYLDLDQFLIINNTCGHAAGDKLLRLVTRVIKEVVRKRDTVARLGDDEFGILMEQCTVANSQRLANTLLKSIEEFQFEWEGERHTVTASIALIPVNEFIGNSMSILENATIVCRMAKNAGGNRICLFDEANEELEQLNGEMQWVPQINRALQEDRFRLYFQPIVPINHGLNKCEILLRMENEEGEIVSPNTFLPAVEHYNLSIKVDKWVVHNVFSWLAKNKQVLDKVSTFGINVSGQTLADRGFIDFVKKEMETYKIAPYCLCFEITETAAIRNFEEASNFINELTALGCHFALDDFGSGLSSFSYLRKFPADTLKIDGMFVKNIDVDPINFSITRSINEVGKVMWKTTVAEYVENDLILNMLREIGVDYAQGYGIAKPQPIAGLLTYGE